MATVALDAPRKFNLTGRNTLVAHLGWSVLFRAVLAVFAVRVSFRDFLHVMERVSDTNTRAV